MRVVYLTELVCIEA